LALPRGCGLPGACLVKFNLSTDEVALSGLREWLSAPQNEHKWYEVLAPATTGPATFLQNLRASGKVTAERLLIHDLVAEKVSAALDVEHSKLKISDLRGDLLGGNHRGDWLLDFTGAKPSYNGAGTLSSISLQRMADAMHDSWISGTADGSYQITESSTDGAEFWQAAGGTMQFELRDAVLPHIALASDEGPLRVTRWQGHARLRAGKIEIEQGKLVSPSGAFVMSGTATLGRALDLKLTRTGAGYSITGTVAEPRVEMSTAETQARLKP
jgi:hypothetical protein